MGPAVVGSDWRRRVLKTLKHTVGMVSMAHAGNPAKADSQVVYRDWPGKPSGWEAPGLRQGDLGHGCVRKLAPEDRIVRATVKAAK